MNKISTNEEVSLSTLFWIFAKIGAFTIGGGYAMIPLIEEEVVAKRKYISEDDFIDMVAVAQSLPGVFAVKIATYIGYKLRGTWGSIVTSTAAALPSFLMILLIAVCFRQIKEYPEVEAIFKGLRPAVVALIAVPTLRLAKRAQLTWQTLWIPIASALLIWYIGVSPIWIILIAGLGGLVLGYHKQQAQKKVREEINTKKSHTQSK